MSAETWTFWISWDKIASIIHTSVFPDTIPIELGVLLLPGKFIGSFLSTAGVWGIVCCCEVVMGTKLSWSPWLRENACSGVAEMLMSYRANTGQVVDADQEQWGPGFPCWPCRWAGSQVPLHRKIWKARIHSFYCCNVSNHYFSMVHCNSWDDGQAVYLPKLACHVSLKKEKSFIKVSK